MSDDIKNLIGELRKSIPKKIAQDLINVQPIDANVGQLFGLIARVDPKYPARIVEILSDEEQKYYFDQPYTCVRISADIYEDVFQWIEETGIDHIKPEEDYINYIHGGCEWSEAHKRQVSFMKIWIDDASLLILKLKWAGC